MTPRRRERVAPPAADDEWEVRYANNDAAKGWEELCRHAPGNTRAAWQDMRTRPRAEDHRHTRLHGRLATVTFEGRQLEQRQLEVSGGGRIWYLVDDQRHTVWLVLAGPGHPKATD